MTFSYVWSRIKNGIEVESGPEGFFEGKMKGKQEVSYTWRVI